MNSKFIRTTTQIETADYESLRKIAFSRRISIAALFREAVKDILKKRLTA